MSTCPPPIRSRQYLSGPTIFWALVSKLGVVGGNYWDIPISLPFPCNTFFIGSIKEGDEANSLYMSFMPTNKPRGTSFATLTGQEQIFPLNPAQLLLSAPHYYGVLKFKEASNLVYFHMGQENGELSQYSIGCVVGTDFDIKGGLYF